MLFTRPNNLNIQEGSVDAVVEIPKGGTLKYEIEKDDEVRLVRTMHSVWKYPFNYGFIPSTLAGDKDPADVIIFSREPIETKTIVKVKILGIVHMVDNGEEDDKILATADGTEMPREDVLYFLDNYKFPKQDGTVLTGVDGVDVAIRYIKDSVYRFTQNDPTAVPARTLSETREAPKPKEIIQPTKPAGDSYGGI